ncbi:type II toxin-antitoxin system VapC family toxin [Lacipirellula limnantheis]|uniref:Toxin VapC4 n=1 Tax=Lacipirellula limnantheis TaxID=2528024 RepID=A0A517TUQ9_9BACT|nr:type II toxin-antitoxin system VapC family toxin [Lacipirellula limnantheis]QDT72109.1 Toxin VapC4 [Lacipirellula limnantheis]
MKLLFGANRYADMARGEPSVVARMEAAEWLYLSVIVVGELRTGFAGGSRSRENEREFERTLQRSNTSILLLDEQTPEFYARVFHSLRRQGTPIPTNDMWIAAQALQHGLALDTRDVHFQHVPGLTLV